MSTIHVQLKNETYTIYNAYGAVNDLPESCRQLLVGSRIVIITDKTVHTYHQEKILRLREQIPDNEIIVLPPGERVKSMYWTRYLYNRLLELKVNRKSILISVGGGVVGDLTGFVAATFMRGIDFIQCPTTLLSMIDASIGGKVAINLPQGKNLVGCFHQPKAVIIDSSFLETLPPRQIRSGVGELIKIFLIDSGPLFYQFEKIHPEKRIATGASFEQWIYDACRLKVTIIEKDEKDTGSRMILNLGHTAAHALEKIQGYKGSTHGELVAFGIFLASCISFIQGKASHSFLEQLAALFKQWEFFPCPYEIPSSEQFLREICYDKKQTNTSIVWILPKDVGIIEMCHTVSPRDIGEALALAKEFQQTK